MAIIAKYKFNSSLCADYLPVFNAEFTGYTKTDVDNGDGTITRTISHDTLKPTYMRFGSDINSSTDREKSLLEVIECDTSEVTNMGNMFQGCSNLTIINTSSFNTSKVSKMNYTFNNCSSLTTLDLSSFNTSNATTFDSMFENCKALTTLNVSSWDTSNVTNMAYMFNNCQSLTSLEVSNFNTGKVTDMFKMFANCSKLTSLNVSNFSTSQVTNMKEMFSGCSSLTSLDVSSFDTSKVTSMRSMFANCRNLTSLNVSNFNTSNVDDMYAMFQKCSQLTSLDLSSFNTSKVTSMNSIFENCSSLTSLNVSSFDTSKVTDISYMFNICSSLTSLDVSNFDTSNATTTRYMFRECSKLTTLDLSNFNTSKVTNMNWMFSGCSKLTTLDLSNFDTSKVTSIGYMFNFCNKLTTLDLSNFDTSNVTDMGNMFQNCLASDIGLLYASSSTINSLLTELGTSTARNIYYMDAPLDELTVQDNITYKKYKLTMATFPYTLNKLPNGVADYIDVVNKVHVQRVGVRDYQETDATDNTVITNTTNTLYELATPIYTPLTEEEIAQLPLSAYANGYVNLSSDQLMPSFEFRMRASNRYQVDMLENGCYYLNAPVGNVKLGTANVDVQQMPCIIKVDNVGTGDSGYRLGLGGEITDTTQITLAKLPSHRIPTTFTQGMKCVADFGYWEGVKVATGKQLYVNETNQLNFNAIELNRIEYGNTIVEDEFDIATGKFTKRIGKYTINGNSNIWGYNTNAYETSTHMSFGCSPIPNFKKAGRCIGFLDLKYGAVNSTDSQECWSNLGVSDYFYFRFRKDRYSYYGAGADSVKAYFNANPTTIYYELEVPEISYVNLSSNQVKTVANSTIIQSSKYNELYLNPQVKPSHLTYPVPSLVGNRTYTVVHNRKNITGSTKPIELNLGGTVVQLNDASSKTLVKTPSTLAHSNLIFIGGESTVDHIMVLDGDWTNKPIEYFENMKGHDTDAIITIIGDSKIDDVAEQYLW